MILTPRRQDHPLLRLSRLASRQDPSFNKEISLSSFEPFVFFCGKNPKPRIATKERKVQKDDHHYLTSGGPRTRMEGIKEITSHCSLHRWRSQRSNAVKP